MSLTNDRLPSGEIPQVVLEHLEALMLVSRQLPEAT